MLLLLSDAASFWIAFLIFLVCYMLISWSALSDDIKDHPWKYREWLEADEAKKKAKEQSRH